MQHPDNDDPWASLADSLGMSGAAEPAPQAPEPRKPLPSREPRKPRQSQSGAAKPPSAWSDPASNLGLEPGAAEPPPPRPAPPPRDRRDERGVARDERGVARDERAVARDERVSHEDRVSRQPQRGDGFGEGNFREGSAAGGEDSAGEERSAGEGRGRRRRGRRGGRRRGVRSEGVSDGDRRDDDRRDDDRLGHPAGDASARDESPIHNRAPSHDDDIDIVDERTLAGGEERPAGEGESRSSDESGEPRRRRRRRGRRGGRRRSGREEGGGEATAARPHGEEGERPAGRRDDQDEEPLPSGYGVVRPPKPTSRTAGEGASGERTDREGDSGDRGRRRRKRGGRRRSERSGEERRSSGSGRRIRGDFAPVAGSFDEDDEGLEFLGLEETGKPRPRREPAAGEEDVLVESGLSEVLDVPSWVEAIGIVIAGNLDARSRHREDRGR